MISVKRSAVHRHPTTNTARIRHGIKHASMLNQGISTIQNTNRNLQTRFQSTTNETPSTKAQPQNIDDFLIDIEQKLYNPDERYTFGNDAEVHPNVVGKSLDDLSKEWTAKLPTTHREVDPIEHVKPDLRVLNQSLRNVVASDTPMLHAAAEYFFKLPGKRFRPMLVLLIGQATNMNEYSKHNRLAEITELIHTASLIHDDVIDESDMRRGAASVNAEFGNKLAVLAGDFLLARASLQLARLQNIRVIEHMSMVIEHLTHGEVLQMASVGSLSFEEYLRKTFYKTASLMAMSAKSTAVLSGCSEDTIQHAFRFGKHLGIAYQLIDDLLDFTGSEQEIGKPSQGADMQMGLVTAPLLFAQQELPELRDIIERQFCREEDIPRALNLVSKSEGLRLTRELAATHCQRAVEAALELPEGKAQASLVRLVGLIAERKK